MKYLVITAIGFLFNQSVYAKINEKYDYQKDAKCVYEGKFTKIDPIKTDNRETIPYGLRLGTFKVEKLIKHENHICEVFKEKFDVLISSGDAGNYITFESCVVPEANKRYRIGLQVIMDGTFIPVFCPKWFEPLK